MTDEVTTQAQQLGTDILAELERAVAQKDAVKEKDIVVDFAAIKKIQEDARAAFAAIVSDYMTKRQALADQARQMKVQAIKDSVA
jgi:hypothetical protein